MTVDRGYHLFLLPLWRRIKSDAWMHRTGIGLWNTKGRRFIAGTSIRHRKLQGTLVTTPENNAAILLVITCSCSFIL